MDRVDGMVHWIMDAVKVIEPLDIPFFNKIY